MQESLQLIKVGFGRCPRGDEAADGVGVVVGFPMGEEDVGLQPVHTVVGDDDKLLVGGRVDVERQTCVGKDAAQTLCHDDGMTGDGHV